MRSVLLFISLFGSLLFGSAFVLSFTHPAFVESAARELIRIEVERRTTEKLETLQGTRIAAIAERMSGRNAEEIDDIKRKLAEGLPKQVATIVAQMRNLDCDCRKAIERRMTGLFEGRVAELSRLNE
jgi:hypothetical protein